MTVSPGSRRSARGSAARGPAAAGRSLRSGALVGVGTAAFLDETLFHQLLHWHHFYDRSTPTVGLVSDGWFHAFGWLALVAGMFLLADVQRRQQLRVRHWWSGFLVGLGAFQLYDGLVQHKLLRLHQIRYAVTLWPYDLVWNVAGLLAVVAGLVLLRRSRAR